MSVSGGAGFLELATGDNGNQPVYIRQYTGVLGGQVTNQVVIPDANGDVIFPKNLVVNNSGVAGNGIVLNQTGLGKIQDLNDGFITFKFTSGLRISPPFDIGTPINNNPTVILSSTQVDAYRGSVSINRVNNAGQARYSVYNGAGVCEWAIGQKSSADSNFSINKIVNNGGVDSQTEYFSVSNSTGNVTLSGVLITSAGTLGSNGNGTRTISVGSTPANDTVGSNGDIWYTI
jgi:hypothetical protein